MPRRTLPAEPRRDDLPTRTILAPPSPRVAVREARFGQQPEAHEAGELGPVLREVLRLQEEGDFCGARGEIEGGEESIQGTGEGGEGQEGVEIEVRG